MKLCPRCQAELADDAQQCLRPGCALPAKQTDSTAAAPGERPGLPPPPPPAFKIAPPPPPIAKIPPPPPPPSGSGTGGIAPPPPPPPPGPIRPLPPPPIKKPVTAPPSAELHARVQQAERNVQASRRRSFWLAAGTLGSLLLALGCWGAYYLTTVLGYAELGNELTIERSPADPDQLILSYQPTKSGLIGFRLADADRESELLDWVGPDEIGRTHTFRWRASGVQPGTAVRITGRQGLRLDGKELLVPERTVARVQGAGLIAAEVINAVNKQPVPGAKLRILGGSLSAVTDAQGHCRIEHAPTGVVPIEVTAEGFTSEQCEREVRPGEPTALRAVLSPGMKAGQIRIVLTWGKEPQDLDAHLEGPLPEGKQFHVYYHDQGDLNSKEFVHLDVDAQDGDGPETITVLGVLPGTYRYWVHDYSHRDDPASTALARSAAEVRVFQGGQTYRYRAGHEMVGNRWNVCTIEVSPQGAIAKRTDTYEGTQLQSLGLYAKRTMGNRQQWIAKYGGSPESETAVEEGLEWLARHQHAMGFWANRCLGSNAQSRCEKPTFCTAAGSTCEMAHSGLALLAFQAAGHYYFNQQKHSDTVRSGLDWLVANQSSDGALVGSLAKPKRKGYHHNFYMYEHGIAAFALADACAAAKEAGAPPESRYVDALAKAVRFIEHQQHNDGGWRYSEVKSLPTDTSVTGWQVLALKSAREAGLDFSAECMTGIHSFFANRATGSQGRTGYTNNRDLTSDATTGVGMLARQFLLNEPDAPLVHDAADYLAQEASRRWTNLPAPGNDRDYYLWYNCTLAMFQAGGENWKRWNEVVRDTIIKLQEHSGCARGSWGPECRWGDAGGRIYSTALAVLTLEVYYRYTPYSEQQAFATEPTKADMPPRTDSVSLEPSKASQGLPVPATDNVVTAPNPGKEKDLQRQIAARFKMPVELSNSIGMMLVLIPAGEFMMGSEDGFSDEKPVHRVRISKSFYLGITEVMQRQYEQVMGTNPSNFKGDAQRPVEIVSWDNAVEFCRKLSQKEGKEYRLPTEAEWEYACRAGSSTKWCFGDDESSLRGYAWYEDNSARTTHPVGQRRANAWGLYDMYGNVWEWCQDWKAEYGSDAVSDPTGPSSGSFRVLRGGSWNSPAGYCRSALRSYYTPVSRYDYLGLRVLLVAEPATEKPRSESTAPLKLQTIPPQTIELGKQLAVAVSVENAKQWEGKVRFSLGPQSPRGAKIDPNTGAFTWRTYLGSGSGKYELAVLAQGPDGQKEQAIFTVTVTKPAPAARKEITVNLGTGVAMQLVPIPAGSFMMGDNEDKPVHRVNITKLFYLSKYEVTQVQWLAVMGSNPSHFKGQNNPVENVSWDDCQDFLGKLNAKAGQRKGKFVLPTEAQWEYACRAGSSTKWCYGDDESSLDEYAWHDKNSASTTHPVGQKRPNAWGLYDMHGNVWEWCQDWKAEYGSDAVSNPSGPSSGSHRVRRGGGWGSTAGYCRSADREGSGPGLRFDLLGLRVLLVPAE